MRKEAELDDVWREKKNNPDQAWRQQASLRPTDDATALCLLLCSPSDGGGYVLAFSWRRAFERAVLEGHMTTSARHALTSSCMAVTVCVIQNPSDMRRWLTSDNCTGKRKKQRDWRRIRRWLSSSRTSTSTSCYVTFMLSKSP